MSPRLRGPAELLGRLRQAGTIAAERAGLAPHGAPPGDGARRPRMPFATPSRQDLTAIYAARPAERDELIAHAGRTLDGRLALLGYEDLSFGTPIEWHADPLRKRRAPEGHWSTIPYLDSERVGDHKLIWELNRHQWLVTLAEAGYLTGDERYLAAAAGHLSAWLDSNPPRTGINWASSLEVAFRSISWTWVLHLAEDHPAFDATLVDRLLTSLDLHGRHIESHLSTWFSPNTHLTGEALGLLYLGSAWPGYPRAATWRRTGWDILLQQLPIHLRRDGTYFEQTTWYLGYTLDFYLHAALLGEREGWSFPASHRERLIAGARALAEFMRPDGTLALIGDDDGGRLLPLAPGARARFADTLALAAVVLGVPELAGTVEAPASVAWIVGSGWRGLAVADRTGPQRSVALPDGGWYFLRAPGGSLCLDAGPHGALSAGHAHADALSIGLELDGTPVIVDGGTFSYIGAERDAFRGPAGHSSLTLGSEASARPAGPFSWRRRAEATLHSWVGAEGWDFVEASHDGFEDRFPGVRHLRAVLRWQSFGWLVIDRLTGAPGNVPGELRFLLAPEWTIAPADSGFEAVRDGGSRRLGITTDGLGDARLETGSVSSCYGRRTDTRVLVRRVPGSALSTGVATLLQPDQGRHALVRTAADGGTEWRWETPGGTVRVRSGSLTGTARFHLVIEGNDGEKLRLDGSEPMGVR